MRSLRFCLCLLLCVCTFFALFSVSISACAVDFTFDGESQELTQVQDGVSTFALVTGHTYSITCTEPLDNQTVTGTIVSDVETNGISLLIRITLASEIEKNTYFDIRMQFNSDTFGSLTSTMYLYDKDYTNSCGSGVSFTGEYVSSKKILDFLEVGGTKRGVKYLEIYINLNSVDWTDTTVYTNNTDGAEYTFRINNTLFAYDPGQSWYDWCNSSYDTAGFSTISNNGANVIAIRNSYGDCLLYCTCHNKTVSYADKITTHSGYKIDLGYGVLDFQEFQFDFSISSVTINTLEEEDVSGGILGWVKSIWNGIVNLPSNIASKISGFFTELGNKISALGDKILDGIKGLFIPSEESITELKEKFEALLADRFGAVYESTAVIDNFANAFFNQAQISVMTENGGTIQFPLVTVDLAGTDFSFGGWDVDIIPDKFQGILDMLKMIIDIVCTFVFINALRKKLEVILS